MVLLSALLAPSGFATNWRALGNSSSSLDKVYIDSDSVEQVDGFRIVRLMTVYSAPRTNKYKITMDSHIQKTAFDCERKMFSGIQTIGYLNGQQVGSNSAAADWETKMVRVGDDPYALRILTVACSLPLTTGKPAPAEIPHTQPKPKFSTGSGFFVNGEGYILTNAHVVKGCKSIAVKTLNADAQSATLEAMDPKNDLALIRTSAGIGLPVQFRPESNPARLGESIAVIGYPLSGILSTEPKATFGQINSVAGVGNDYTLLQISAPVQAGSSGSPVLDESGRVVAVVISELSPLLIARFVSIPQNVNFAIRGEVAQIFMQAYGVKFKVGDRKKKLRTDEIADAGQRSAALVVCAYE